MGSWKTRPGPLGDGTPLVRIAVTTAAETFADFAVPSRAPATPKIAVSTANMTKSIDFVHSNVDDSSIEPLKLPRGQVFVRRDTETQQAGRLIPAPRCLNH